MNNGNQYSKAVKRMLEYISKHLKEPITVGELAREAGYSQYHMTRVFKKETGLSPFEYIRRERLINSAFELRRGSVRVIDIAFDYIFDSHEGFTRAFSNAFGISPKKYSGYPAPYGWLIPYSYLDRQKLKSEEKIMDNTAVIFTQIVERPARKLILYRSKSAEHYMQYVEETGCDVVWDYLCGIKEALYEPVGVWLPENMRPEGTGIYAHGVEVPIDYSGELPNGYDAIDLPPCKYLIFQGEPYDDEYYEKAVGACMERIGKFNPEVYGYQYYDEIAPKFQLAPMGWRGYIEGRAVKEIAK